MCVLYLPNNNNNFVYLSYLQFLCVPFGHVAGYDAESEGGLSAGQRHFAHLLREEGAFGARRLPVHAGGGAEAAKSSPECAVADREGPRGEEGLRHWTAKCATNLLGMLFMFPLCFFFSPPIHTVSYGL